MNSLTRYLFIFLGLTCASPQLAADDAIALQHGDIIVTEEDIDRYIISNTPEKDRNSILAKKNAFKEMIENIYIFRSLANEAQQDPTLNWKQLNWAIEMQRSRMTALALLKNEEVKALNEHNWEPAAKEVYLAESERFSVPEMVRVSHLLIKTEGRGESEAKTLTQEARKQALSGKDFKELVARYSEDPSAKNNNGDLGFIRRGQMVKTFENAAFSMKRPGEISPVLKTRFGFHIIKFEARKKAAKIPFSAVKQEITTQLKSAKKNQLRQDHFIKLRSEAALFIDKDVLKELQNKYRP